MGKQSFILSAGHLFLGPAVGRAVKEIEIIPLQVNMFRSGDTCSHVL